MGQEYGQKSSQKLLKLTVFHFLSNLNQFDGGLLTIFRLLAARTQKEKCGNTSSAFDSYICVCRQHFGGCINLRGDGCVQPKTDTIQKAFMSAFFTFPDRTA